MLRVAAVEDDAGARLVIVTADLLKMPPDMAWRTKRWASERLGLPSAALIMNLSHTHSRSFCPGVLSAVAAGHRLRLLV